MRPQPQASHCPYIHILVKYRAYMPIHIIYIYTHVHTYTSSESVCVYAHIRAFPDSHYRIQGIPEKSSLTIKAVVNTGWDQVLGALTANTEPQRTQTPNPRRTTLAALWVRAFRVWGC